MDTCKRRKWCAMSGDRSETKSNTSNAQSYSNVEQKKNVWKDGSCAIMKDIHLWHWWCLIQVHSDQINSSRKCSCKSSTDFSLHIPSQVRIKQRFERDGWIKLPFPQQPPEDACLIYYWFLSETAPFFSFFFPCTPIKDSKDLKQILNAKCCNSLLLTVLAGVHHNFNIDGE